MANLKAQGTVIKIGDGATPEVFTTVAQVRGISGFDGSASEIDVTNLLSTAKEITPGLPDEGSVTLELIYDPDDTQQSALETARTAQTLDNYQVVLTDTTPTTLAFAAYVMAFSKNFSIDEAVTGSVTLRISGAVTKS